MSARDRVPTASAVVEDLLTVAEAAARLGLGSSHIVEVWCRRRALRCERRGDQTLISATEIDAFGTTVLAAAMHRADRIHDETADLGGATPLSDEELEALTASRPGRRPWQDVNLPPGADGPA